MSYKEFSTKDLGELLEKKRGQAIVRCRMLKPFVGGIAAGPEGISRFVQHQVGIPEDSPEHDKAVKRIIAEEIGSRDITPEGGELKDQKVYGINVIRKSEHGYFGLGHMIVACLKVSASKLGLFVSKKGSKGDMAEMGTALAYGASLRNPEKPWEIYLVDKDGNPLAAEFHKISGTVSTPSGRKSIVHHSEVIPDACCVEAQRKRVIPEVLNRESKHHTATAIISSSSPPIA